jgi:hypothetical protein
MVFILHMVTFVQEKPKISLAQFGISGNLESVRSQADGGVLLLALWRIIKVALKKFTS